MQENHIEKRKEDISQAFENFLNHAVEKNKEDQPESTFLKVVESLNKKGRFLPNEKIIDIATVYTAQGKYFYTIKFSNKVTLLFEIDEMCVSVKMDGKVQNLNQEESQKYYDKYFDYTKEFLAEKNRMYSNTTVSEKLEELGI